MHRNIFSTIFIYIFTITMGIGIRKSIRGINFAKDFVKGSLT